MLQAQNLAAQGTPPHRVTTLMFSSARARRRISGSPGRPVRAWGTAPGPARQSTGVQAGQQGQAKAAVLPLPVLAWAIRSLPSSAGGRLAAWMGSSGGSRAAAGWKAGRAQGQCAEGQCWPGLGTSYPDYPGRGPPSDQRQHTHKRQGMGHDARHHGQRIAPAPLTRATRHLLHACSESAAIRAMGSPDRLPVGGHRAPARPQWRRASASAASSAPASMPVSPSQRVSPAPHLDGGEQGARSPPHRAA